MSSKPQVPTFSRVCTLLSFLLTWNTVWCIKCILNEQFGSKSTHTATHAHVIQLLHFADTLYTIIKVKWRKSVERFFTACDLRRDYFGMLFSADAGKHIYTDFEINLFLWQNILLVVCVNMNVMRKLRFSFSFFFQKKYLLLFSSIKANEQNKNHALSMLGKWIW